MDNRALSRYLGEIWDTLLSAPGLFTPYLIWCFGWSGIRQYNFAMTWAVGQMHIPKCRLVPPQDAKMEEEMGVKENNSYAGEWLSTYILRKNVELIWSFYIHMYTEILAFSI